LALFNRKTRYYLIKVTGLLSIIRWQNILITALAQYLAVLFVFNPSESKLELFLDIHLHLIVLATACAVAGGYIINSFYDLEKDLINRPERTLFNRVVSKDFCLKFYFLMNGLTMVSALLVSVNVAIFFAAFIFLLWFYSHKMQKVFLLKELIASLLSTLSVLCVALYYNYMTGIILAYSAHFALLLYSKEILKDFINLPGDVAVGNSSLVQVWGNTGATVFYACIQVLTAALLSWVLAHTLSTELAVYIFIAWIMMLTTLLLLFKKKSEKVLKAVYLTHRILILLAILFIVFV
jgi:4-hydroxybenzoate polyprenyltransferase